MKKTILITGASGFIGGHCVRFFYKKKYNIIALSRSKVSYDTRDFVEYYQADLIKDKLPKEVDVVIHAAGLADDIADWEDLYLNNVVGTHRLYNEVEHKKFIHISSSSVYSMDTKMHYEKESVALGKLTLYGQSKYLGDQFLIQKNPRDKSIYILRPRAVYGPNDSTLLPKIKKLKKGKYFITPGKLSYSVSLTHINNLMRGIDLCLQNEDKLGTHIYNIADDKIYNLREIIRTILNSVSKQNLRQLTLPLKFVFRVAELLQFLKVKTTFNKTSLQILCQDNTLNIDKIKLELGYAPEFNFGAYMNEK